MEMYYRSIDYDGNVYERYQKVYNSYNETAYYFYQVHLTLSMDRDIWYKFYVPGNGDIKWENLSRCYSRKTRGNRSLTADLKEIIVYVISDFNYNINLINVYESCCAILRFIRHRCTSVDELLQCLMHFEQYTLLDVRTECLAVLKSVCMLFIYTIILVHPEKTL